MTSERSREDLARLLRQQEELGVGDLFLEGLTRDEALRLAGGREEGRRTKPDRTQRPHRLGGPATRVARTEAPSSAPSDVPGDALAGLDYEGLKAVALVCERCRLARERTQVVFSDGNPRARLMVVGEAPGANEDRTGLPFVGQAGKLLDLQLAAIDLSRRDTVYICNVLKCRPPGNRDPMQDEIDLCSPYLKRQIELVGPEAILAVGSFSARLLTGMNKPLGRLRGEVYSYQGVPLVVSYHPAALLRNAGWTRAAWDDFQLLRQVLDER